MYYATTRGIEVLVTPRYLPERSQPDDGRYAFSYTVIIVNRSTRPVRLMTRRWTVADAQGHVREVRGDGVAGKQPLLEPGESFEYTSGVPLLSPSGVMAGTYGMATDDGVSFDIDVPAFSLDADGAPRVIH